MSRKTPNDRLRALQFEAGWSAESLARAVNALGTAQGLVLHYDRSSVAHWLAGAQPRGRVGVLIAEALARQVGRPLTPADVGIGPGPGNPRSGGEAALMTHEALIASVADLAAAAADAVQRSYQASTIYPLLQVRTVIAALPSLLGDETAPSLRLATHTSSHIAAVDFFQQQAETCGGGLVRGSLAAYVYNACTMANAASAEEPDPALAGLTAALAWTHADDGAPGVAWTLYEHALHLALHRRDRLGAACVLEAMGAQALDLNHPIEAAALSEAADVAAGGKDPELRAGVRIQLAAALAASGRTSDAHRLRDLAGHQPSDRRPDPVLKLLWSHTPSVRATWHRRLAQIFGILREPTKAASHLRLALRHCASHDQRGIALTHVELCRTLLTTGHIDAACGYGHQAYEIAGRLRSSAVRDALAALGAWLAPFSGNASARKLIARLQVF